MKPINLKMCAFGPYKDEVEIEIHETVSGKFIDSTFDVAFSDKETSSPTLIVDIEAEKLNQQI
jgi:hypothetical protein